MREFIINWLDPISVVLGIVMAIPIFWTWYEVSLGRKHRYKAWLKEAKKGKGIDAVLIVDLLAGGDMKAGVVKYLAEQGVEIPDKHIFEINEHGAMTVDKLPSVVEKLRENLSEISNISPGELHVFFGGPGAFAMIIGAELSNKGNVHAYQHTDGKYTDWGPIRHAYL